ncbi:GNAT family N-acetyltransferase [Aridibaculum aurantiacum]|uniref:GNAT family N-acetyltransferase n=1 Tax=Aridibaculum aurantiacum TaxID=2810307 RepID=UPI001A964E6B|nr:GNAT family N-acetyltransferase [Aridibaculum aurantiacum]
MMITHVVKRTDTSDPGFQQLVHKLDHELWNELLEDQATYDPLNKVPDIKTAVLVYVNNEAAACGCFKEYATGTIEVKRMFVQKEYRGKGLSKIVLQELEQWAKELGYHSALLETSIHFDVAINLYKSNGYVQVKNYPPYEGFEESICLGKRLTIE